MEIIHKTDFGKFLKEYRTDNNLTQEELAIKLGIPQQSISRLEAGKINPSLLSIIKYLLKLGCEIKIVKNIEGDYNEE